MERKQIGMDNGMRDVAGGRGQILRARGGERKYHMIERETGMGSDQREMRQFNTCRPVHAAHARDLLTIAHHLGTNTYIPSP